VQHAMIADTCGAVTLYVNTRMHTRACTQADAWFAASLPLLPSARPEELPNMLWGVARLGLQPPQPWVSAALDQVLHLLPHLTGQGLSMSVYSVSHQVKPRGTQLPP